MLENLYLIFDNVARSSKVLSVPVKLFSLVDNASLVMNNCDVHLNTRNKTHNYKIFLTAQHVRLMIVIYLF